MVLKRYAAADFLASASDFETFGNTCAEAASVGTPALVQRGPGFVDQVSASETAATLAMPRASAARFRRRLSENS